MLLTSKQRCRRASDARQQGATDSSLQNPCRGLQSLCSSVGWLLLLTTNRWARQIPTSGHSYRFHTMGSRTYYLSTAAGWYLDNNLWIYFDGFALFFLIASLYGVRWKRVR